MNPTIKEVAKKANVSIATVSRILNKTSAGYSEKTRLKVLEAIEEIGYRPNAIARGLINKKTHTIGVLFPVVSGMVTSEILKGIEDVAHELGHSVIVCNTDSNGKRTRKYLELMREKQVDGIIYSSETITDEYHQLLQEMNVPVVLVSSESFKFPYPYVKVDDQKAAFTATEYLIKNGHRKIGMISGNRNDKVAGMPRIFGYQQALETYNLPYNEDYIISGRGFSFQEGKELFPELFKRLQGMTALFAASDEIAIGAISKAHELGIRVPEDLSIIGYDDIKLAEMTVPTLTTVRQPFNKMGGISAKMLFEMMNGAEKIDNRVIQHELIERNSVKPLA